MRMYLLLITVAGFLVPEVAEARSPGDPIRLVWSEGDVAGLTTIYAADAREPIGFVEYHQTVRENRLSSVRVAHFRDGSSDEDSAEARVEGTLETLSGRSIIRDVDGEPIADVHIDVAGGHIRATWGRGEDRRSMDEPVALPRGTYWGPLIFIVLKNFDANAEEGHLVFRTVAPTPKPMVLDMEMARDGHTRLERTNVRLEADTFHLSPTVHWMVDPVVRLIAPRATFWILPGDPPAMARFSGPRNYGRQEIVIQ
jgi:hypothetical protein